MGCRSGGSRVGLAPPATPCAAAVDRLIRRLPQGCGSAPAQPSSPFRRDTPAGRRAQRDRSPLRTRRARLLGRLRHCPTLDCAAAFRSAGSTSVRSDLLEASHHPMAHHRPGRIVAGESRLHRGALPRRTGAGVGRLGRAAPSLNSCAGAIPPA